MIPIKYMLPIAIVVIAAVGCASSTPENTALIPYSELINAREQFIEKFNRSPQGLSADAAWAKTDPQLRALLTSYHVATAVRPKERGELYFLVTNESGQPLDGVKAEVLGVSHPDPLAMEPTVAQRYVTVDKECRLKWPPNVHSIELKLSKAGYRPIYIQFNPQAPDELRRYTMAMEMLEEGYVLTPTEPVGPIRIVLPPRIDWDPPAESESRDGHSGVDLANLPKIISSNAQIIATSANPRLFLAPVRGVYVLVNNKGEVLGGVRLDRGNELGFIGLMACVLGGGNNEDPAGAPYEWRLYSIAKPRAPASQQSQLGSWTYPLLASAQAAEPDPATQPSNPRPVSQPTAGPEQQAFTPENPAAPSYYVEMTLASEKQVKFGLTKMREAIEQWNDLAPDKKQAALQLFQRISENMDAFFKKLHDGQSISMRELLEFTAQNNLMGQLSVVWKDESGQLVKQFQQRAAESTVGMRPLVAGFGDLEHPTQQMEAELAKLQLTGDQQRQVNIVLADYRKQIEKLTQGLDQIQDGAQAQIAGARARSEGIIVADQTWHRLSEILTPEQRRQFAKNQPRIEG